MVASVCLLALGRAGAADGGAAAAAVARQDYELAAALLDEQLAADPADQTARFMLARVLAWSADYAAALAQYDALLASWPDNVDYVFGRAQTLVWAGRDAAALADLAHARALAPRYEAVWQLELAILDRNAAAMPERSVLRAEAARLFPDAAWWHETEPQAASSSAAAPTTELTAGAVHETLSSGAPDWRSLFVQMRHPLDAERTLQGGVSREERFGASDTRLTGGVDWRLPSRWSSGFELGLVTDPKFSARAIVTAWALRALPRGWEAEVRLRHRAYRDADVSSTALNIARYFGDFRVAYAVDFARLRGDSTTAAHSAAVTYYASARTQLTANIAVGEEAEAVAPGLVLRTDVRAVSVGGRHALDARWGASWWFGSHRQGDLYRRRYVGVSVSRGL